MESPYANPVTPITDVSPYFKEDKKTRTMYFIGETLEIRVPARYAVYDLLTIEDTVTTLGVMDMIIDGKYQVAMNMLAKFTMIPSDFGHMTYKGAAYNIFFLQKGDVFMTSTQVVRDTSVVYALWVEFITRGKPIYTMSYRGLGMLFDKVRYFTGRGIGVGRPVYEAIIGFLARDPDDPAVPYRLTAMKQDMRLIALRSVSLAPTGTIARMNGSYNDAGMTAALRYEVKDQQVFENILRGIPQAMGMKPFDDQG